MNFSENTNLLPGGQSASPSKVRELENKIDDLAQTVTSVADSVADLADEVTTAELNATSANVTNAVIDNATVGEETVTTVNATTVNADNLNATDADITNLTADDVEANSVDADNGYFGSVNAQSFTGQNVNVSGDITASNKVQGKTVQATEKVVTPALESTTTELKGKTTVRGDVYFPETGDKIYGEYLEIEADKVKVNSLITETPTGSSRLVGYDANGNLIPVDAGLDPSNYWELVPGDQTSIQPKDNKKIEATEITTPKLNTEDINAGGNVTINGELSAESTTLSDTYLYSASITENLNVFGDVYVERGETTLRDTEVDGDLTVNGDIIQNGSAYETHAEKVYSKNDLIITRDGAVSGLSTGQYTGIQAKKYDGTNDGQLVFDKDGEARVGDVGDTEPLMTRDELADMTAGSLLKWDGTNKKAVCAQSADIIPSDASASNKLATANSLSTALGQKITNLPTSGITDCNNAPVGFMCGMNVANAPNNTTQYIYLLTLNVNNDMNYQQQTCVLVNNTNLFRRVRINGTWGAWYEIINKNEINSLLADLLANKSYGDETVITNGYYTKLTVTVSQTYTTSIIAMLTRGAGLCIAGVSAGDSGNAIVKGYIKETGAYTSTFYYKAISTTTAEFYFKTSAYTTRTNYQILSNAEYTTVTAEQVLNLPEGVTEITQNQTLPGYTKLTASGSTSINLSNITFNELVVEVESSRNVNYTFNILKDMLTTSNKSYYSGRYVSANSNSSCQINASTTSINLAALFIYTGNGSTNITTDSTLNVYYR